MEITEIELRAFRIRSERRTTELHPYVNLNDIIQLIRCIKPPLAALNTVKITSFYLVFNVPFLRFLAIVSKT